SPDRVLARRRIELAADEPELRERPARHPERLEAPLSDPLPAHRRVHVEHAEAEQSSTRLGHDAQDGLSVDTQAHVDGPAAAALGELSRSVDGIDVPAALRISPVAVV